jgi:hypothetical protein
MTEKLALQGRAVGESGKAVGRFRMDLGLPIRNEARAGEVILKMEWDILPG